MELAKLIRQRGVIKFKLTRFEKLLSSVQTAKNDNTLTSPDAIQLKDELNTLLTVREDFETLQNEIDDLSENIEEELATREEVYDRFSKARAHAQDLLNKIEISNSSSNSRRSSNASVNALNHNDAHRFSSVKLPTIKLPEFDGTAKKWLAYRDTFESVINKRTDLSDIEKFHYLRSTLKSEAFNFANAQEFSEENYDTVWQSLCARYNDNRLLLHDHLKSLFEIEKMRKRNVFGLTKLKECLLQHIKSLERLVPPSNSEK